MPKNYVMSPECQGIATLALGCAVMCTSVQNIRLLIKGGLPVNARGRTGWTALHVAAIVGHEASVKCLLDLGADKNARNHKQETPLHFAAEHGKVKVVELLIAAGADLEVCDVMGDTALQVAVAWNFETVVNVLLKAGAKMTARCSQARMHLNIMQDVSNLMEHLKLDVEEKL